MVEPGVVCVEDDIYRGAGSCQLPAVAFQAVATCNVALSLAWLLALQRLLRLEWYASGKVVTAFAFGVGLAAFGGVLCVPMFVARAVFA